MTEKRYVLGDVGCYRTRLIIDNSNNHELGNNMVCQRLNELSDENEQLKRQIIDLEEELDYFKAKNGSLETGMFNLERENGQLKRLIDDIKKGRVYDDKRGF